MKRINKAAGRHGEAALYARIRELIFAARRSVSRGVDLVQVWTNFEIGRHIVEYEQAGAAKAAYGWRIVNVLSGKLAMEFGRGFSRSNLEYMRKFFLLYRERVVISQSETGKSKPASSAKTSISQFRTGKFIASASNPSPFCLSWTHYVFLIGIRNTDERSFYEIESAEQGWNLDELKRQFDSGLYERLALSRDKAGIRRLAHEGQIVNKPPDMLKEPLVLEFLGLTEQ